MTPRCALLLFALAQTARARSATVAAIASNADYANLLYGSSNAVDPSKLRVVWPDLMPPKLRAGLRVECGQPRRQTLFYERHFLQRRALWVHRPSGFEDDDLPVGRGRGPAGWGVLLFRFMIGAETTVIVLLLWVAAAGRAPAVGCRGWHVRISI